MSTEPSSAGSNPPTAPPQPPSRTVETILVIMVVAVVSAGLAKRFSPKEDSERNAARSAKSPEVADLPRTRSGTPTEGRGKIYQGGNQAKVYSAAYALLVGNSEYSQGSSWSHLPGVKKDLAKVKARLIKAGFQVEVQENLTGRQLGAAFDKFVQTYGSGEDQEMNCLLIYYAGHGCTLNNTYDKNERAYLVGVDAPSSTKRGQFESESYDMSYFKNLSEQIQAKHAIFLFDSCFSGNFFTQTRSQMSAEVAEAAARHVRQFVTAGSKGQTVADDSEFCRQFLVAMDGMADANRDNYVTGTELGNFLSANVSLKTNKRQTPVWGKSEKEQLAEGDFIFPMDEADPVKPAEARPRDTGRTDLDFTNSLLMTFRKIGGSKISNREFIARDARRYDPLVKVRAEKQQDINLEATIKLTNYVYLCRHEVRWADYRGIMGRGPDAIPDGGTEPGTELHPVTGVTWNEAREFCRQLTEHERRLNKLEEGWEYRLPWEAEWDLAALDPYTHEIERCDDMAGPRYWELVYKGQKMLTVGKEAPNRAGFNDLHSNALEWCHDSFVPGLPQDEMLNPRGTFDGTWRVVRGRLKTVMWQAATSGAPQQSRVSLRCAGFTPDTALPCLGFRIVKAPVDATIPSNPTELLQDVEDKMFTSRFFANTEYGKDQVDEKTGDTARKGILLKAHRRLAETGYASATDKVLVEDLYVSSVFRRNLLNFQWINHLPVTETLNPETLAKLKLNGLSTSEAVQLAEIEGLTPPKPPVKVAASSEKSSQGGGSSSGVSRPASNNNSGEADWVRNSGIKIWLPYAAGHAASHFGR